MGELGRAESRILNACQKTHAFCVWTGKLSELSFILGPGVTIYTGVREGREAAALLKTLKRLASRTECTNE